MLLFFDFLFVMSKSISNFACYSVEYTYTIPEKVGGFDCVLDDMEVVAFVHGDIKDKDNREIYNADKVEIAN